MNSKIPKGRLLIIGGAEDKGEEQLPIASENSQFVDMEILKQLVSKETLTARIEVITTATNEAEDVRAMYEHAFERLGYKNVGFLDIQDKVEARNPEVTERILKAETVLFSGGDQFKIATILGGSPTVDALLEKYMADKDFTVAGTSAGAMVLSKIMIQGGGVNEAMLRSDLKTSAGLGFLEDCIIDTHFIRRGRFGRLAHAITSNPGHLGIGLGEDTALEIRRGRVATCLGSGMVVIIDGRDIEQTNVFSVSEGHPIYVDNLRVHLLVKDCHFDIQTCQLEYPSTEE